jgi:hypothetical protein
MRARLTAVAALSAILTVVAAGPAEPAAPKKLSETKARKFLKPLVTDIGAGVAQDLKTEDPTVSLVDARVGDCRRRSRRRIDCDLNFTFRAQAEPDLTCSLRVSVKYRNRRSKRLVFALLSDQPKCFTPG